MSIAELRHGFEDLHNRPVDDLIEGQVTAAASDSISQIISILFQRNSYDLFIELSGKVAAIKMRDLLDVRDIARAYANILGKIIPTLNRQSRVAEAASLMSLYRLRSLPIIDNNKIIGQITAKKIVQVMKDCMDTRHLRKTSASYIMTSNPIVISKTDTVSGAKAIMKRRRIDHLPVVDNYKSVGMITSEDILKIISGSERIGRKSLGIDQTNSRLDLEVGGIANNNIVSVDVQDSLQSAVELILSQNSTYCLLESVGEIQGIITYRDIISLLAEKLPEDVPTFLIGLPDDPLDAELAKSKFAKIVKLLKTTYPDIEEARCRIKIRDIQRARKRYELDSSIISTHRSINYANTGWDLARMFDQMSDSLKKRMAHRVTTKQRNSKFSTRELV
jgi:CBS domain-containing protein